MARDNVLHCYRSYHACRKGMRDFIKGLEYSEMNLCKLRVNTTGETHYFLPVRGAEDLGNLHGLKFAAVHWEDGQPDPWLDMTLLSRHLVPSGRC